MSLSKKFSDQRIPWFWIGMLGIFLVSLALRFWGLGRFNALVFDEVYYAKFGNNYLTHTKFFDGHPPLSKYLIAISMWIGDRLPFGQDTVNSLTGSPHSTWSYRWLNALTGSFVPWVIAAIAYQLSYRRSYALIAGIFAAADGMFLVESRYALNNVFLVILGLLGQLFLLLALGARSSRRWSFLAIAGVFFGCAASIKWNGLWFLLGAYFIWIAAWVLQRIRNDVVDESKVSELALPQERLLPLQKLTQLNLLTFLTNFFIIPVIAYSLIWIPHIQQNPEYGLVEVQKQILSYHQRVGGNDVHPYCSPWWSWLLMLRPIAYYYKTASNTAAPIPELPPLPPGATGQLIYDVHSIGNPILWWLSTGAILFLLFHVAKSVAVAKGFFSKPPTPETWIALYLVLNWLANLLPWVRVTRCTFLYHYIGCSVFSLLALAWIVDRWLTSYKREYRAIALTAIFFILMAFLFWMPIYLGLPLSPEAYRLRMPYFNISGLPPWLQQLLPRWI
jgi:dolichyl-phosphate-mannose--protein O-mannosyl transferase